MTEKKKKPEARRNHAAAPVDRAWKAQTSAHAQANAVTSSPTLRIPAALVPDSLRPRAQDHDITSPSTEKYPLARDRGVSRKDPATAENIWVGGSSY